MHRPVRAFCEHAVSHAVVQAFDDGVHRLAVVEHLLEPVPHARNRQDADETQELAHQRLAEHVRPRAEERPVPEVLQDDERVHQRVAVVGREEHGPIGRDFVLVLGGDPAEEAAAGGVAPGLQQEVSSVFLVRFSHINR